MLKIEKYKNGEYDAFIITTNEGEFCISFQNNLDLYWSYLHKRSILDTPNSHTFKITKENMFFYNLIDTLYNDIKENKLRIVGEDSIYQYSYRIPDKLHKSLFIDNEIRWHCDDFYYDVASVLKIKEENKEYHITFEKSKDDNFYRPSYSIRIRNSGSRYSPYNIIFMRMYRALCEYNYDYHQIHIEEYLYNQKKVKKLKK